MEILKKSVYVTGYLSKAEQAALEFNRGEIETEDEIAERWTARVQPYGDDNWLVMLYDYYGNELGSLPFTTELVFDQNGSLLSCKLK
jgi:hypothetical protein